MKLRSQLVLLALVALLPLAILAAVYGTFLIEQQRQIFRQGAEARVHALITAVDSELRGSVDVLRALANVRSVDESDLHYFRESAAQVLAGQSNWTTINLALPDGQQIVNLRVPEGERLPMLPADKAFLAVVQAMQAAVGDLVVGPVTKQWDFAVRVPVIRAGRLRYILSAVVKPESIGRLISAQGLPAEWDGIVLDQEGRIVTRTAQPESMGQFASDALQMALRESTSGWYRSTSPAGVARYRAYRRSDVTGWTFALGIPAKAVEATAARAVWIFGISLSLAVLLAFGLVQLVSRRIAQPITELAAATDRLVRGEAVEVPSSRLHELQSLEIALRRAVHAQAALREADRHKDEFLAMLSHELRNPLAALTAAAHVLRVSDAGDPASATARGVMERQTEHMARLVEDLLELTRIKMGKVVLKREPVDLAALVADTVRIWRMPGRLAEHARLKVHASSVWVDGDQARLTQVFSNLLHNALKFTRPGDPIDVFVQEHDGAALLRVVDAGRGMDPDVLQQIFEPFVQTEQSFERAEGGLGLGLAVVERLVRLHGGTVTAQSEGPGRGACFTVRMPAIPAPQPSQVAELAPTRKGLRVLLVEDNHDVRNTLCKALQLMGHEVHEAASGLAGVSCALDVKPDLMIVDLGLPDIDGYEVARRLRSRGTACPKLIAVSGYGQESDIRRSAEVGFDLHLVKPVAAERLDKAMIQLARRTSAAPA